MNAVLTADAPVAQRIEPNLKRFARKVSVPNPEQVRAYLSANPQIIEIAEKVCELASAEFSETAELSLELYVDPEIDDRYLTLYVQQLNPNQSTWERVERIRESYEEELAGLSGWLHVTVDYRSPESRN